MGQLSILAIGAHPDDIELGCGGSLARYARDGARIGALVFSKGRRGALSDQDRAAETALAFERIGVTDVTVLDFEDTRLFSALNEMIEHIEQRVAALSPDRVYTMFHLDRHQDHRAVYEASAIACRRVPQLLGYETPSSYPNFQPTLFEDISGELETKIEALRCHKSQGDRIYMQEDRIRAAAHFRGAQAELGLCESFMPYKMIL